MMFINGMAPKPTLLSIISQIKDENITRIQIRSLAWDLKYLHLLPISSDSHQTRLEFFLLYLLESTISTSAFDDEFGEVRFEQLGFTSLNFSVLNWFIPQVLIELY